MGEKSGLLEPRMLSNNPVPQSWTNIWEEIFCNILRIEEYSISPGIFCRGFGKEWQKWPVANLPGGANLDIFYFKIREFIICGFVN